MKHARSSVSHALHLLLIAVAGAGGGWAGYNIYPGAKYSVHRRILIIPTPPHGPGDLIPDECPPAIDVWMDEFNKKSFYELVLSHARSRGIDLQCTADDLYGDVDAELSRHPVAITVTVRSCDPSKLEQRLTAVMDAFCEAGFQRAQKARELSAKGFNVNTRIDYQQYAERTRDPLLPALGDDLTRYFVLGGVAAGLGLGLIAVRILGEVRRRSQRRIVPAN